MGMTNRELEIQALEDRIGPVAHITFDGPDGTRIAHTIPTAEFFGWREDDPSIHVHTHASLDEAQARQGQPNIGNPTPVYFTPVVNR